MKNEKKKKGKGKTTLNKNLKFHFSFFFLNLHTNHTREQTQFILESYHKRKFIPNTLIPI